MNIFSIIRPELYRLNVRRLPEYVLHFDGSVTYGSREAG